MRNLKVVSFILLASNICSAFNLVKYLVKDTNTFISDALQDFNITLHPDFGLDIYQFLRKYQYPIETHWVQTEDGYVLRMQRIPSGKNVTNLKTRSKPAILLMHGLTGSSMNWITIGERSLAFKLADQGFDVWLGNNRGNTWSREHATLNPDTDSEYWDFSYEKCGQYDLPANIDYIIQQTGQQKIFYVGHSQGTTQFFAMAALRPGYNDKIALFSAFAPVVYVQNMASPILRTLAANQDTAKKLLTNINELLSYNPLISKTLGVFCAAGSPFEDLCAMVLFLFGGFDSPQLEKSVLSLFLSESPNGISKNMMLHYGQNIKSGFFQRYDYGTELNLKYYGTAVPPNFTLSAISAPVALYYSQNDLLVPVKAVERLANELPNVVKLRLVANKLYNHFDYVFAKDVDTIVYQELVAHLKEIIDNGGTTTTTTPSPINGASTITINFICSAILVLSMLWLH